MSRRVSLGLAVVLGTAVGLVAVQLLMPYFAATDSDGLTRAERIKKHAAGAPKEGEASSLEMVGERVPLDIESPGITDAVFVKVAEADLPDHVRVMGVEVDGQFRAYLIEGMGDFDQHLVHDEINGRRISIVYCDKTDTCRAFDRGTTEEDQFLMGGWSGRQLLLRLGEQEFELNSSEIPLDDYPHQRTTWGEWKQAHPDSLLFEGNGWDG